MDKKVLQKAKRMGAVAQEIFNMYLENTWTHDIDSVKVDDKEGQPIRVNVTAAQGYEAGPRKESKNERLGGGWYFRVPLQQDNQQTAKAAILAHENSIWQLVVMANIVKGLFKGSLPIPHLR
jgi:hypothetical protein